MRSKAFSWLVAVLMTGGLLACPAWAEEEKAKDKDDKKKLAEEKAKSEKDKDKAKNEEKKPDPIKRLIEIKIDPFLVPARMLNIPFPGRIRTSQDLLERLEKLAQDDSVGAVLLNLDGLSLSMPDVEELRKGVQSFRKAGKKVTAFLNSGDPNSYMLACVADEIAIAPSGSLFLPGLGRLFPYMRGLYQLQGIEFDVITAGEYKYPGFMNRREPDKFFLEEFEAIMDSWYGDYVGTIADGRKLSKDKVKQIVDKAIFEAEEAKNYDLVDVIAYYDDYRDRILRREKFKKGADDESGLANVTSLQDVLSQITREMKKAQERYKEVGPKIAVLHARGPIVDMSMGNNLMANSMIMRDDFVKTIEEIRKNKTIQGVVLNVDSPGGSAYASDIIWRNLKQLDEEKPLVVRMGTVAGSGGYYIACPGRLIFAEPTTITGSIGVLAILANQASAYNRMDMNLHEMKRGEKALLGAGHRDMKPEDRKLIQDYVLKTYDQFIDRVADGRKMPQNEIRKLAGGRVYTGRQALDIGLVDRLGGLKDAIAAVREMANIPPSAEIKLVHYPRPSSWGELAEGFLGFSMMMEAMKQAETPALSIPFDRQLRYFAQQPKPLCWMAMPEVNWLSPQASPAQDAMELLGLPVTDPGLLLRPLADR